MKADDSTEEGEGRSEIHVVQTSGSFINAMRILIGWK